MIRPYDGRAGAKGGKGLKGEKGAKGGGERFECLGLSFEFRGCRRRDAKRITGRRTRPTHLRIYAGTAGRRLEAEGRRNHD